MMSNTIPFYLGMIMVFSPILFISVCAHYFGDRGFAISTGLVLMAIAILLIWVGVTDNV